MLTKEIIKEKTADLAKEYTDFLVHDFGEFDKFAAGAQRLADGEKVSMEEIPEAFVSEFKMMSAVLEMQATGNFDWNNQILREAFQEAVQTPFYKIWGEVITKLSLRLAECTGVRTFVEIGAGRGNLTRIMLKLMADHQAPPRLLVSDADPVVLENVEKQKSTTPGMPFETFVWDIKDAPPAELMARIQPPCLLYERASILYTTVPAIENLARIADIAVFGDYFNNTGRLYAYDEVFKKIGSQPLLYRDVKPVLEKHFREHLLFDADVQEHINIPNVTLLIAWK